MTEEKIEIKSREYAEGRGHEHYNFLFEENAGSPVDFARLCYADGLKDGATEATKELQKGNENLRSIADYQQSSNMKRYFEIKELKEQTEELQDKLANADYQLEGRDLEIKELEAQLEREKNLNQCFLDNNEQLREMIEKTKSCSTCENCDDFGNCFNALKVCRECVEHSNWQLKELAE